MMSRRAADLSAFIDRLFEQAAGHDELEDNPRTIDEYIAEARADMGEARWQELNGEWL